MIAAASLATTSETSMTFVAVFEVRMERVCNCKRESLAEERREDPQRPPHLPRQSSGRSAKAVMTAFSSLSTKSYSLE